jgi:hypothetical protein
MKCKKCGEEIRILIPNYFGTKNTLTFYCPNICGTTYTIYLDPLLIDEIEKRIEKKDA